MSTPTTTIATIRDSCVTLVKAVSPTLLPGVSFRVHRGEQDFRAWAEANPHAALRTFDIRQDGTSEPGDVSNLDSERTTTSLVLECAYPHKTLAQYGPDNMRDMDDVIESDAFQIRGAIGQKGYASWVSGQHDAFDTHTIDEAEEMSFLVVTLEVSYQRSM